MRETRIYYAQFSANNGTRFFRNLTGRNKAKLINAVRSAANAERFAGHPANRRAVAIACASGGIYLARRVYLGTHNLTHRR